MDDAGKLTKAAVAEVLGQELSRLSGESLAGDLAPDLLLSQIVSSRGFVQLLVAIEKRLGLTIDDEDFYEAAPVSVGELIDFLYLQAVPTRQSS